MIVKVSSTNLFQSLGVHGDVARALISKSSHKQICHNGADGRPHGCPFFQLVQLILEWKIGVCEEKFK